MSGKEADGYAIKALETNEAPSHLPVLTHYLSNSQSTIARLYR